jgi:hypothetical protein
MLRLFANFFFLILLLLRQSAIHAQDSHHDFPDDSFLQLFGPEHGLNSKVAVLSHFSQRTLPEELLTTEPPPEAYRQRADDALQNRFHLQGITAIQPNRPDGGLDWNHRGPRNDKEWAWMLNRHHFLMDLYHAWKETADTRYLEAINELWLDWIKANPYPARITFSAPWRPLEASRRIMHSWVELFFALQDYPQFEPETRLRVLASIREHGDLLHRFPSFWGGNHLITEKTALAKLAVAFPEFAESAEWLEQGSQAVIDQYQRQTYPDGAYMELTNHYQRVTLLNAQTFLRILEAANDHRKYQSFRPIVESMWDYFIGVMTPDGTGPINNAADLEWNRHHALEVVDYYDRDDWRHILSYGEQGQPPVTGPSRLFPWAGHLVIRNHWGRDADWGFFHLGPQGTAHEHEDHLHLDVYTGGRPFLTDSGRYTYQPGLWKEFFTGPAAHNILLIDGKGAIPPPRSVSQPMEFAVQIQADGRVSASGSSRFASMAASGRGSKEHRRAILYHPKGFWIVVDQVIAFGPREVAIHWHFHPDVNPEAAALGLQLIHQPVNTREHSYRGQETPFIAGHYSPSYNLREPRIQKIYSQKSPGPAKWIWLIQNPWQEPVVESWEYDPQSRTLQLNGEKWTEVISLRVGRAGSPSWPQQADSIDQSDRNQSTQ